MNRKRCANCSERFSPQKHILNQRYCSKKECQKARRRKWEQSRLRNDKDYRTYRKESFKKWRAKNPDYRLRYKQNLADAGKLGKERHRKIKILIEEDVLANLTKNGEINCICRIVLKP